MKVLQIKNEKIFQNTNSKNFANLIGEDCDFDFALGDMIILQNNNFENKHAKTNILSLDYKQKNYLYYVIKPIDTLESVCKKFEISKSYIFDKNSCKRFFVGQKIIVGEL